MRIAFRADASVDIGSGHVMRCLALAKTLAESGSDVTFVCRELPGSLCDFIQGRGFNVRRLRGESFDEHRDAGQTAIALSGARGKFDWLVVDHYGLGAGWEVVVRQCAHKIMSIDDLARRPHDCDLLLDQNISLEVEDRYAQLVPTKCCRLIGPKYALLRPEFPRARAELKLRPGRFRRLLLFFSGSDPHNETAKALEGLRQLSRLELAIDVVVGTSNPHRERVSVMCRELPNTTYHCQVEDMAQLMIRADLAVGGGGVTTLERCCLGLPALVAVLADNQEAPTVAAASRGAVVNLGRAESLKAADYARAVASVTGNQLLAMQENALRLVDGLGCERVAHALATS